MTSEAPELCAASKHRVAVYIRKVPAGLTEGSRVAAALEELGCTVVRMSDDPWQPDAGSMLLILGNAAWYPRLLRQLLNEPKQDLPSVVLWHWEPLPPPKTSGLRWPLPTLRELAKIVLHDKRANDIYTNYNCVRKLAQKRAVDLLAVSTLGRQEFLAERGISAQHVPLGYSPDHGRDLQLERNIDVLFLGETRILRRKRVIARLRRSGVNVTVRGDWADPACWGESRSRLINHARIFLNVQRFAGEFSGLRMILAMSNKALVVSEPMYKPAPFIPGKHYVSAAIDEMPEVIGHYLASGEERQRMVNEAYRLVTEEMPLKRSVARLLDLTAGLQKNRSD